MNFCINTYLANPEYRQPLVSTHAIGVVCKDGFKVSIQASHTHYCRPRVDIGPWETVELGFPSAAPEFGIMEFVEDSDCPTETVYAQVPVGLVNQLIDFHGGPDYEAILARKAKHTSNTD